MNFLVLITPGKPFSHHKASTITLILVVVDVCISLKVSTKGNKGVQSNHSFHHVLALDYLQSSEGKLILQTINAMHSMLSLVAKNKLYGGYMCILTTANEKNTGGDRERERKRERGERER